MGFVCEIGIAGALIGTFNVNAGIQNPPERACAGAAMIVAAEKGGAVPFKLTSDSGETIAAGTGTATRLDDKNNLFQFNIQTNDGQEKKIQWTPAILEKLKAQAAKDMTPRR